MRRYAYKRDYIWGNDIAYLAGLFASDGCLINNGRHLVMTSTDMMIIDFVKLIAQTTAKERIKIGSYAGTPAFHLQFSNVALYDFFLGIGLTPAKSLTMPALNVPDEYFADFLRGYFDGDGTTYGYFDPRWRSSFMFYVQYVSASLRFIEYLRSKNTLLFGTTSGAIRKNNNALTLSYAKADAHKLASAMYYSEFMPALERKRSKLESFVAVDNTVIMCRNARVL